MRQVGPGRTCTVPLRAGGAGAMGRRLVPQLAARGHEVTASSGSGNHDPTATTRLRSSSVSARATSTLNVRSQEPSAAHIRGRSQSFLRLAYFSPRAHRLLPSGSPGDQFGRVCGEDGLPGGDPSVPVGTGAQQPVQ